jgi:hypothetical protein
MRAKRTVTEAVLAANRKNSKSSTGPQTARGKSYSSQNAVSSGLLAKRVAFANQDELLEFQILFQSLHDELRPCGLVEKFLVEEIATLFWKLQIALGLETRELLNVQNLRERLRNFLQGDVKFPLSAEDLPSDRGWACDRLVVRAVGTGDTGASSNSASRVEVEAVLGNSIANLTRYQLGLTNRVYRALDMLHKLRERSE